MRTVEILDVINEAEELYPVDRWVIDGVHVWPLIRFMFFSENNDVYNKNVPNSMSRNALVKKVKQAFRILRGLSRFGWACVRDYERNEKFHAAEVAILSDGISYVRLHGAWYDRFCDPLISRFNDEGLTCFLMSPLHECFIPRYSPSMFIQPHLDYIKIKNALFSSHFRANRMKLEGFSALVDALRAKGSSIVLPDLRRLQSALAQIKGFSRFYKRILDKVNPAVALQVCYYGVEGMAFNLACRELGIPSVDIQHGMQGDFHIAYGRWASVPEKGYELLPTLFWCWTDYEAQAIEKWSVKVSQWHRPVVGGNLFLKLWQSKNHEIVEFYDQRIVALKKKHGDVVHILCTLGGVNDAELDRVVSIVQTAKHLGLPYCFWVRLHPCKLGQRRKVTRMLERRGIKDVELDQATNLPLYALLRHMGLHITEFSSTVIEAQVFGVPSVLMDPLGADGYPEQVSSGWALPAYTAEEVMDAMQIQLGRRNSLRETKVTGSENDGFSVLQNLIEKERSKDG